MHARVKSTCNGGTGEGNSSTVLRLQNKCHVVELDSMMGGDGHILTSLFDDDMTNLLLTEIQKQ